MAKHSATPKIGCVRAALLSRHMRTELNRIVADILGTGQSLPGSSLLNQHIRSSVQLAALVQSLGAHHKVKAFFGDPRAALLSIRPQDQAQWLSAAIGRVHRQALGEQADALAPGQAFSNA